MGYCGGACVDVVANENHCGFCGRRCDAGRRCVAGACEVDCPASTQFCGASTEGNAICADLKTDRNHCGACSIACRDTEACEDGECRTQCLPSETRCTNRCVNLANDHEFCGDCRTVCADLEACRGGLCCAAREENCGGQCADLAVQREHCGACGFACGGATPFCGRGRCIACNNRILILHSTYSSVSSNTLVLELRARGYDVELVRSPNALSAYNGVPDARTFGAVLLLSRYSEYIPYAAQAILADAHEAGTGFVLTEPFGYAQTYYFYYPYLDKLILQRTEYSYWYAPAAITLDAGREGNPLWTGLPKSIALPKSYGYFGSARTGAQTVASCDPCGSVATRSGPVVFTRDDGKSGRVAYFSHAIAEDASWDDQLIEAVLPLQRAGGSS